MKTNPVRLLSVFVLPVLLSCLWQQGYCQQTGPGRPNIIFIMADDHAYQAISAYGSTLIHTPNIDRIGREGAIMKNEFVTNSVCSPSPPTLLDYAGISIPADMQGASIRPLLEKGNAPNWRKEIYYHYYELSFGLTRHYGIYTGRYKLMHFYNPIDAWEL